MIVMMTTTPSAGPKTIVLTGGTEGIGYAAIIQLAACPATEKISDPQYK